MRNGLHDHNPVIGTAARKERSRDRVLTNTEIKALWDHLADDDFGAIVRLLILTGQRASEIGDLHWSEIDLDRGLISLPAKRTKNGRPHEVPMSEPVRQIRRGRSPMAATLCLAPAPVVCPAGQAQGQGGPGDRRQARRATAALDYSRSAQNGGDRDG